MNLHGIVSHGCRSTHVFRQGLQVHRHFFRSGPGIFNGIGTNDGNGIPELENLFIA